MEIELPSMPTSIRTPYQARLTSSKSELNKVKKSLVSFEPILYSFVHCLKRFVLSSRKTCREILNDLIYSETEVQEENGATLVTPMNLILTIHQGTIVIKGEDYWLGQRL
jgi:hypothetical protein